MSSQNPSEVGVEPGGLLGLSGNSHNSRRNEIPRLQAIRWNMFTQNVHRPPLASSWVPTPIHTL